MSERDPVNHPAHYTNGGIEVIDAIEAWELGYHLGNVVKYVARAKHKGRFLEDLKKARWYLDREIQQQEKHWNLHERQKELNENRRNASPDPSASRGPRKTTDGRAGQSEYRAASQAGVGADLQAT